MLIKDKTIASNRVHSLTMKVAHAEKREVQHVSKIRSVVSKSRVVNENQLRRATKRLFKINKKEYSAEFIKLTTEMSNTGQNSIQATVKCTKAVFEFLTGEVPEHWVAPSTLSRDCRLKI
jgi:hypothetical protein